MGGQSSGYQSQPMNQWGGGQRFGGGGFGGGYGMGNYNNNFSNRAPMYGQQSSQNYGGSGGSQQPMSYDAYMQAHAGQPIQSSDYGNYVQGFNQSQNQQPFTGRGGGTYTPGMNLFGNGGGNQYGNPFGQFMQQWPQFNGFQSGWQPQYQQPQSQQPQFSPASQDMNQDMVPTRTQGMVRLPPINYDQYQKQPNQYEYLNGGNSPFSQVA